MIGRSKALFASALAVFVTAGQMMAGPAAQAVNRPQAGMDALKRDQENIAKDFYQSIDKHNG